jgi:NADPH-dependent ferric siderophore reductase
MALPEAYFHAEVIRTEQLTPVLKRLILGGDGLTDFESSGAPDEWLQMMVPAQDQRHVELPRKSGSHWEFANPQPVARWYSVRKWDADRNEMWIDVVIHSSGLATRWASEVEVGDQVIVSAPHGRLSEMQADWMLILADQTAIPAATRIIEELPADFSVHAVFEAPNEAATFTPSTTASLRTCWVYNPSPDEIPSPLSAAARSVDLPAGQGFVWMAGEASCARDIRRYFRHELKWRSSSYDIVGYWRPNSEAYSRRYTQVSDEVERIYEGGLAVGKDPETVLDDVFSVMERHGL